MWESLQSSLFRYYLNYKYRAKRIKKYVNEDKVFIDSNSVIIKSFLENKKNSNKVIRAAAVQMEMKIYENPYDFANKMEEFVFFAKKNGADLLVFPEENLLQLIGLLPDLAELSNNNRSRSTKKDLKKEKNYENKSIVEKENNKVKKENITKEITIEKILADLGMDISIIDILAFIGPTIKNISLAIFSALAQKYGLFIMTGSGFLPDSLKEKQNIYNIAYLFGANGEFIGEQKKCHLLPMETQWGISRGDSINIYNTDIGKLSFPICMDASYFESFKIASMKGAQIIMIPIANPDPDYNYWTALRGIWGRVQESNVYGIKSAMIGDFFGFHLSGQAGIYAPLPLSRNLDGIIAESRTYNQEEIVIADLDLDLLEDYKKGIIEEDNRVFIDRYFPTVYQKDLE
ncbi:MAG: nitrilase-related carbon-nitrogen hydrolase, partial [Bacillota bacterium]